MVVLGCILTLFTMMLTVFCLKEGNTKKEYLVLLAFLVANLIFVANCTWNMILK